MRKRQQLSLVWAAVTSFVVLALVSCATPAGVATSPAGRTGQGGAVGQNNASSIQDSGTLVPSPTAPSTVEPKEDEQALAAATSQPSSSPSGAGGQEQPAPPDATPVASNEASAASEYDPTQDPRNYINIDPRPVRPEHFEQKTPGDGSHPIRYYTGPFSVTREADGSILVGNKVRLVKPDDPRVSKNWRKVGTMWIYIPDFVPEEEGECPRGEAPATMDYNGFAALTQCTVKNMYEELADAFLVSAYQVGSFESLLEGVSPQEQRLIRRNFELQQKPYQERTPAEQAELDRFACQVFPNFALVRNRYVSPPPDKEALYPDWACRDRGGLFGPKFGSRVLSYTTVISAPYYFFVPPYPLIAKNPLSVFSRQVFWHGWEGEGVVAKANELRRIRNELFVAHICHYIPGPALFNANTTVWADYLRGVNGWPSYEIDLRYDYFVDVTSPGCEPLFVTYARTPEQGWRWVFTDGLAWTAVGHNDFDDQVEFFKWFLEENNYTLPMYEEFPMPE